MKLDWAKDPIEAYGEATAVAGDAVTNELAHALDEAKAKNTAPLDLIDAETGVLKREAFRRAYLEQDLYMPIRNNAFCSLVHEQQVEGLPLVAENSKWPWIEEARRYSEKADSNFQKEGEAHMGLYDWPFGVNLPGKWLARTTMSALILCTQSISGALRPAPCHDCGLSLPDRSY